MIRKAPAQPQEEQQFHSKYSKKSQCCDTIVHIIEIIIAWGRVVLKYRYYLFDFDGTIADTGEGIRRSVAYSAEKLGYAVPDVEVLNRFIGPPLHDSYKRYFGMTDDQAEHAIQVYRERYIDIGLYESNLYPGIPALLKALRERGAYVALASAKPQMMLERLTKYFGIDGDLDAISGTDLSRHSADKQDLLMAALPGGANPGEVCMVGDRCLDSEAAKALGRHAVGADYG